MTQTIDLERHKVRLFPSVHITTDREAELRATAALLALIKAVPEFGKEIVKTSGGPSGRLGCYTEVPMTLHASGKKDHAELRPDGVIVSTRGKKTWTALVEVKVDRNDLSQDQIDAYHRLARQIGAAAVITVSNQPARPDGRPPVNVDGRRSRGIPVVHFSWERLLSEARLLAKKKAVSDPEQKWILDEWIRYVDDPRSRIIVPPDLGPHWATVAKAAGTRTLDQVEKELRDVIEHWKAYLKRAALQLRAKLGADVDVRLTRKEKNDPQLGSDILAARALSSGELAGTLRIHDAAGDVHIDLILPSKVVRYSTAIEAPSEGRQKTRVKWIWRQLRALNEQGHLPSDSEIEAHWSARNAKTTAPMTLFLEDPDVLLTDNSGAPISSDLYPKRYLLRWSRKLKSSRGKNTAPVLAGVSDGLEVFYQAVQGIRPFTPKAPQLPDKKGNEPNVQDSQAMAHE